MEPRPAFAVAVRRWYEPWMEDARCSWVDPDSWFPEKGGNNRLAKAICRQQCPVRDACLDYAMQFETGAGAWVRFGIYGGMSPSERRKYEPEWLAGQQGAA